MPELSIIQKFALWAIPILFAITVHEVAHGWVASLRGDQTARMMGRLTLNPIKHIDPIGTILVPAILLWIGGFMFGWAKPVPVNFSALKHPKRDMILVAAAGPGANLLMALFWGLILKLAMVLEPTLGNNPALLLGVMAQGGILINLVLMVLNLIPIPPLDGGRILSGFLPNNLSRIVDQIEPYGFIILVILLATQILGKILGPPVFGLYRLILGLFGIS